ncbi:MAG: sugar kinase [Clostridia bacterium]|nr:sugar kinase [Clostridia bacterium]
MIWTMGELIVEIMREKEDTPLDKAGVFLGPFPSGAPGIFIDTVARLGHEAGIIGGVGRDDFGKCLLDRLGGDGVDVSQVLVDETCSTGCAFVTYFGDGSRKFIFHIGNTPAAKAVCPETVPAADYFHIMGCSVMSRVEFGREIVKAAKKFREAGAKISFDPNIRPELLGDSSLVSEIVGMTSVFMPGVSELLMITGRDTVEDAVKKCFDDGVIEIVALKNGSKGCRIFERDGGYFEMGVYPMKPVDATGAGDSFDAAFLCGLCEGLGIPDATRKASAAATLNIGAFGPMEGKINPENVKAIIDANPGI